MLLHSGDNSTRKSCQAFSASNGIGRSVCGTLTTFSIDRVPSPMVEILIDTFVGFW